MALEEVAVVRRTPVGDSFVSEALLEWGDFGGEPSGAWIFPRHSLCPDGVYAAALFCRIAGETDIAAEIDTIPRYPVIRSSVPCSNPAAAMHSLGAVSPTDGIRVSEEEGWYLIRASGTEPKVRVTAEGRDEETAGRLAATAMELLKGVMV
jgi:phosphoglucosamine mutase